MPLGRMEAAPRFMAALLWALIIMGKPASAETPISDLISRGEWRVRDVAANSGFAPAGEDSVAPALDLGLSSQASERHDITYRSCTVTNTRGGDRAVTLAFVIPVDARRWTWWDDPVSRRTIGAAGIYGNITEQYYGYTLMASRYPLAAIDNGIEAICLAAPIKPARLVRFIYDAGALELRVEFDLGLSEIPRNFPSQASTTVLAFSAPPHQAFRQALAQYYEIHREDLQRRAGIGGTLLTKTPLCDIPNPEDFFFTWHDFAEQALGFAADDDKAGIASFLYREPQTDWRNLREETKTTSSSPENHGQDRLPEQTPRNYDNFLKQLREDAGNGNRESQTTITSGAETHDGRYFIYLGNIAWTSLAPFALNAAPGISTEEYNGWPNKAQFELEAYQSLLGWSGSPTSMEGVFYDSMEGFGDILNYRQGHWKSTELPIIFDRQHDNRPCLLNLFGNNQFAQTLAAGLHAHGQLLMGNDAFHKTWFHMPFVDIPGREVQYTESEETYRFFRAMAVRRPFWTLLNDQYDDPAAIERYFQRSLFYGFFPSFFHEHDGKSPWYWATPEYYNRDRSLFRKYLPLIRRLDNAGWEVLPHAGSDPETAHIERFGRVETGDLAYTLHNTAESEAQVTLTLSLTGLGASSVESASEWLNDRPVTIEKYSKDTTQLTLALPPKGYAAIGIQAAPIGRH